MPDAPVPALPTTLLPTLLELLPSGVACYTPVHDAAGAVVDFRFAYLNPAAQRLLRLPAQPTASYAEQFPASRANGGLAWHCATYLSGAPGHCELSYQADGYDNYFRADGQRVEDALLVTFSTVAHQPHPAVEEALRQSQTREHLAQQALARERNVLRAVLAQAPVGIGVFQGEELVVAAANNALCAMWGYAPEQVVGRPWLEGVPELRGQGFEELMREVARTRQPFTGRETPAELLENGQLHTHYYNFIFQPFADAAGEPLGVMAIASNVTEQVLARHQVQNLNEELAASNEELRASNEEYFYTNAALTEAQHELSALNQELRALNQDLGARVAERTQAAQRAQAAAEQQRWRFEQLVMRAPVAICVFDGPTWIYELVNPRYQQLFPGRHLQGRPLVAALPEVAGQPLLAILQEVYDTGVTFESPAVLVPLARTAGGPIEDIYFDLAYQARYDEAGRIDGFVTFATDVTTQVLARQRIEAEERQASLLNEELQVANEEIRANNDVLTRTQLALLELNNELEARVRARTREVEAARQAAEDQQQNLRQLFNQTPVAIALLRGPQHQVELINEPNAALLGSTVAHLLGQPIFEALPGLRNQGFEAVLEQALLGETITLEEVAVTLDRAHLNLPDQGYFHVTHQPWRGEQGDIMGVIAVTVEVTEQVWNRRLLEEKERQTNRLNEELHAANDEILANNTALARTQAQLHELNKELEARVQARTRQLAQQQALLQQILGHVPAVVATLDGPEHQYSFFNEQYKQLTGGRARLGVTMSEAMPEFVEQGFVARLDEVYRTGVAYVGNAVLLQMRQVATGQFRRHYVDFIYQPMLDEHGQPQSILIFAIDVTERVLARQQLEAQEQHTKALNQELTTTNRQLTRTNADLDNFIYTASHDLKAPISNIEGLLNLLRELLPAAVRADAQVAPVLHHMRGAVERFTRTIGHLTEVSKLQAEFGQPAGPLLLAAVVEDVRQDLLPLLTEAGATLEVHVGDYRPRVFSEKNLRSIIYNLLSNALKYRAFDRAPWARITCRAEADQLVIEVQDNGLGLSEQQQARLFQLFQRLHTHVEGTGLGLYMVKSIVDNASGTLTVQSQAGVGTTFTITFAA